MDGEAEFFIAIAGQQRGPLLVGRLLAEGATPSTLVWREGMPAWQAAGVVPELAGLFGGGSSPVGMPPLPQMAIPIGYAYSQPPLPTNVQSQKLLAGLMGIFFGGWGVHRFILGDVSGGVIRIVITLATCGVGAIIGLIEGIIYLTKSDADFYDLYMLQKRTWF